MNSFRNRLLVLILGLSIVTQSVTLIAVLARTARIVETRGAEQLMSGGSVVQQFVNFRATQLATGVAVLASDFGFREAIASGDAATMRSAAKNHSARIGADLALMLDNQGQLLASAGQFTPKAGASFKQLLDEAGEARDQAHFAVLGDRSYQFFLAPVRAPEAVAWVAMGFAVDDALARRVRDLVGVEVSLVAFGRDGEPRVASTLPPDERVMLASVRGHFADSEKSPHVVHLGSMEYLSFSRGLATEGDSLTFVLQKPMRLVLAPYYEVRTALFWICGIALALAAVIGWMLGRGASQPIGELVRAARRIQEGTYDRVVKVSGGEEFKSLAETFNAMQSNIAEREARITHAAYHDSLTGLPNREFALQHLDERLRNASSVAHLALIAIDLRNVKQINASFGHHVGDKVLQESAERLRRNISPNDLVARLAANHFLVIAQDYALERAPLLAEQLVTVIRSGFHLPSVSLDLHVAAGVCVFPDHGADSGELLRRVQIAVEDADVLRSRVVLYRLGRDEEHRRRLALIADFRNALEHDTLSLVFQPKVTMAEKMVKSLEALVRWKHPTLGNISPSEFVPLAEQTGNSRRLTSWVLRVAVRQMAEWKQEGLDIEMAVNLSAQDILDPTLPDEVLETLRAYRVPPTALVLEITESVFMQDVALAVRHMQILRISGVRFSIDDFGTGYSSLSQLSRLPVDELKIDRAFITHAHERNDDKTIITSTIELGHSMGLKVVAEGVEQPEGWNLLRRLGCDYAQGFLISRPLSAVDVAKFVREANQLLPATDSTMTQIRVLEQLSSSTRQR
jgi:diguanylate cyclase (GGDEF)-like protein